MIIIIIVIIIIVVIIVIIAIIGRQEKDINTLMKLESLFLSLSHLFPFS